MERARPIRNRSPERIRQIAFWILSRHASGELPHELKASDLIDLLIEIDPTLEGDENTASPLVEMRRKIEKIKLENAGKFVSNR